MLPKRYNCHAIITLTFLLVAHGGNCSQEIQAGLGEPCTEDIECLADLSVCDNNICSCVPNAIKNPAGDKCLKLAEALDDSCEISQQCTEGTPGAYSRCDTTTDKCACNNLAIPSRDNKRCLPKIDFIGGNCEITEQCTNGNQDPSLKLCLQGKCMCAGQAVREPEGHVCYPVVDFVDQSCVIVEQCTASIGELSECKGTCQCKTGAVANLDGPRPNSKCYPRGLFIGAPCVDRAQCVGDPNLSSICTGAGFCDCRGDWTPTIALDNCLAIQNKIGGDCVESQQCQKGDPGRYSSCQGKICNCTSEAITDGEGDICYKKANQVGEECKVDAQCIINLERSLCLHDRCECMADATPSRDGSKCLLKRGLGQSCVESSQCRHMGEAVCQTIGQVKTCQCDSGYRSHPKVKDQCIKLASVIGDPCREDDTQCGSLEGAHCSSDKVCSCKDGEEIPNLKGIKCLKLMRSLGDGCEENQQCLVEDSECLPISNPFGPRACQCKSGYVIGREDTNTCHPARHNIGDHCNDPAQCTMGSVPCLEHKCQCPSPLEFFVDGCVTPKLLHQSCDSHDQCHIGINNLTVCVAANGQPERRCTCLPIAMEIENSCWAVKTVGDSCTTDEECYKIIVGPVHCNNVTSRCTCDEKYRPAAGGLQCSGASNLVNHLTLVNFVSVYLLVICLLELGK